MADWTLMLAASITAGEPVMVSSGQKLYYIGDGSGDGGIYEYDPDDNSELLILDVSGTFGGAGCVGLDCYNTIQDLAWFNDNLYFGLSRLVGSTIKTQVGRWNGSFNSYTAVCEFPDVDESHQSYPYPPNLFVVGGNLVAVTQGYPATVYYAESRHSSDGNSWVSSPDGWDNIVDTDVNTNLGERRNVWFANNQCFALYEDTGAAPNKYMIYKYDVEAHQWKQQKYDYVLPEPSASVDFMQSAPPPGEKHWTGVGFTSYTEDWTNEVWPAPSGTVQPIFVIDIDEQLGIHKDDDDKIYTFDESAGEWNLLDTLGSLKILGAGAIAATMRDNKTYMLAEAQGGGWNIYRRGVTAPEPLSYAEFWHGAGSLNYEFDFGFGGTNPGGMAVKGALGTMVAGSDADQEEMVNYSEHPYDSAVNMTEGIPTGTPITSMEWI